MGSRGSEFGRRRRDNVVNLFKELDAAFDKAYVATDGNTKEENEANLKAYNEIWNKVYDAGLADGYIDWLTAGKPNDWKPNNNKEPEPTPASETERREQERRESEPEPDTNNTGNNAPSPYSQDRKDNALWAKTKKDASDALLPETSRAWAQMTDEEKIVVRSYSGKLAGELNEYLREGLNPSTFGTTTGEFYENNIQTPLDLLTSAIDKSTLQQDTWLQRGMDKSALKKMLGINNFSEIQTLIQDGEILQDKGFMSTSSGKGIASYSDNKPVIVNVYAPKGTKGLYINPISKYGDELVKIGHDTIVGDFGYTKKVPKLIQDWDGHTSHLYGAEQETILQRGMKYRVTKYENNGGKIFLDIEIIGNQY